MRTRPDVAKKYILYRDERARLRKYGWEMTDLQRDIYEKKNIDMIMNPLMNF